MADIRLSTNLPASADDIWKLIGNFNALPDWHPAVEKSDLEDGGKQRRVTVAGGGEIVERLEAHADEDYTYTYSIVSSPFPVANYRSTVRIVPKDDGTSEVEWLGSFEAVGTENEAIKTMQGVYQAGIDNLRKMFGG